MPGSIISENFGLNEFQYRSINNANYQTASGQWGYHTTTHIGSVILSDSYKDIGFKWLFDLNKEAEIFKRITLDIPIKLILDNMTLLAAPIHGNFIETTGEKLFRRISRVFFRSLYWQQKVFVSLDFFKEGNYEIDKHLNDEQKNQIKKKIEYYKKRGGFDVWVKQGAEDNPDDVNFMHIESGIIIKIHDWMETMAKCDWSDRNTDNHFIQFFEFAFDYITSIKRITILEHILSKRIQITTRKGFGADVQKNDFANKISDLSGYYIKDDDDKALIEPVLFASGEDLKSLSLVTFNRLDRRLAELGRVANTNPKGDRLSTGENYKDITSIADRQNIILTDLIAFADDVEDKFAIKLNFAVNGIPQMQVVPMVGHTAPVPVSFEGGQGGSGGSSGGGFGTP